MKSPFPGMDPFIEACGLWGDFHDDLISEIKRALASNIPEQYLVRTGERSYVALLRTPHEWRAFIPDVSVSLARGSKAKRRGIAGAAVAAAKEKASPVTMRAFVELEQRESFVEIYESGGEQRLVTAIEVLSPSNKQPGTPGWELYLRKREALLRGSVNLVEIDLLRGGTRFPMLDPWPMDPYSVLVNRAQSNLCEVWPIRLQSPVLPIPIPLAAPDSDVALDVQPMIAAIYERSRYGHSIDYATSLTPRLTGKDATWVKQLLRKGASRTK